MTTGYGNLGISPLGTYGLGATSGYSSYDMFMPSSYMNGMNYGLGMGMNGSIFGMGGYGMDAMLQYPLLYGQMQAQMETNQLNHAIQMQNGMNQYAVLSNRSSDKALIQKIMNNGDIQYYIDNLYQKVKEGDQKGIQEQYKALREAILNTYSNEFDKMGTNINRYTTANEIIKSVYNSKISAQTGQAADLENDIKRNGSGAFGTGFKSGFRSGSHGQYVDQTLQYCFGRNIDQKDSKDTAKIAGMAVGSLANIAEKGAYGAIAGIALTEAGRGIVRLFGKTPATNVLDSIKKSGRVGLIAGAVLGVYFVGKNIYNSIKAACSNA